MKYFVSRSRPRKDIVIGLEVIENIFHKVLSCSIHLCTLNCRSWKLFGNTFKSKPLHSFVRLIGEKKVDRSKCGSLQKCMSRAFVFCNVHQWSRQLAPTLRFYYWMSNSFPSSTIDMFLLTIGRVLTVSLMLSYIERKWKIYFFLICIFRDS